MVRNAKFYIQLGLDSIDWIWMLLLNPVFFFYIISFLQHVRGHGMRNVDFLLRSYSVLVTFGVCTHV